jgi:hypothetical protein
MIMLGPSIVETQGTDHLSREQSREDIRELCDLLERVHPDPYTGFGGRVAYSRSKHTLLEELPDDGVSVADLRGRIAGFLSQLVDGHTGLSRMDLANEDHPRSYLPVRFSTCADGIFISDATQGHDQLIGALVQAVDGSPADEIATRTGVLFPSENLAGSRRRLASVLASHRLVQVVLPDIGDSLPLSLRLRDADRPQQFALTYDLDLAQRRAGAWQAQKVERIAPINGPFGHAILDDGRVGYLKLKAMWSREAFENMKAAGRTDLGDWLVSAYERFQGDVPPTDHDEAIRDFPSLIESVSQLLLEMHAEGSRDLIVDLRDNDGGFSIIGEPLLYQIYGRAYLEMSDPVYFATRVSREYLEIRGQTLEDLSGPGDDPVHMGDMLFDPPLGMKNRVRARETFFAELKRKGFSRVDRLQDPPAQGFRVVAVVNDGTFSAAFDLAYHLYRMGATLVGTSPSQSPRAFTDSTPFTLKNSGLEGSMSRSAVVFPRIPAVDGSVVVDLPMTWSFLRSMDFHPDAPILAALDWLRAGDRMATPVRED